MPHAAVSCCKAGSKQDATVALTDMCALTAETQACELCHVYQLGEHILWRPDLRCVACQGKALQAGQLCVHAVQHAAGLRWLKVASQGYRQAVKLR